MKRERPRKESTKTFNRDSNKPVFTPHLFRRRDFLKYRQLTPIEIFVSLVYTHGDIKLLWYKLLESSYVDSIFEPFKLGLMSDKRSCLKTYYLTKGIAMPYVLCDHSAITIIDNLKRGHLYFCGKPIITDGYTLSHSEIDDPQNQGDMNMETQPMKLRYKQLSIRDFCDAVVQNRNYVVSSLSILLDPNYVSLLTQAVSNQPNIKDSILYAQTEETLKLYRLSMPYIVYTHSLNQVLSLANIGETKIEGEQIMLRNRPSKEQIVMYPEPSLNVNTADDWFKLTRGPSIHHTDLENIFCVDIEEIKRRFESSLTSNITFKSTIDSKMIHRYYLRVMSIIKSILPSMETDYPRFVFDTVFPTIENDRATIVIKYYDMKTDYKVVETLREIKFPEDINTLIVEGNQPMKNIGANEPATQV